ncbi:MAG: hypothetical protein JSS27_11860 [Planctomycetes bacterium]|nr:hypothetical protein [Planctomycetota bacterium]
MPAILAAHHGREQLVERPNMVGQPGHHRSGRPLLAAWVDVTQVSSL